MQKLERIIRELELDSAITSPKREHLWAKFRITTKIKQVQSFQKGLSEVRSTLMLGLMYQKCVSGSLNRSGLIVLALTKHI